MAAAAEVKLDVAGSIGRDLVGGVCPIVADDGRPVLEAIIPHDVVQHLVHSGTILGTLHDPDVDTTSEPQESTSERPIYVEGYRTAFCGHRMLWMPAE